MAALAFHFGATNRQRLQFHFPYRYSVARLRGGRYVWAPPEPPPVWSGTALLRGGRFVKSDIVEPTEPWSGIALSRRSIFRWKPPPFVGEIPPANLLAHHTGGRLSNAKDAALSHRDPWNVATAGERPSRIVLGSAESFPSVTRIPAANAALGAEDSRAVWRDAIVFDNAGTRSPARTSDLGTISSGMPWRDAARLWQARWSPVNRCDLILRPLTHLFSNAIVRGATLRHSLDEARVLERMLGDRMPWDGAHLTFGLSWPWPPLPPLPPIVRRTALRFHFHPPRDARLVFHFGREPAYVLPVHRSYHMEHSILLVRLPERTVIPATSIDVSMGWDEWCWSFSTALVGADAIDLLRPSGADTLLELTLDGYVWQFRVDQVNANIEFAKNSGTARGRSRSALLGPDVALATNGYEQAAMTARQLCEQELVGTDWQLDWPLDSFPDWLVPARRLDYEMKTPVEVIVKIVEAAGGRIASHPSQSWLHVRPKWPVPPWQWASTPPDVVLPRALMKTLSWQPRSGKPWDAVFLGDGKTVSCKATRTGLPGASIPDSALVEPLLSHLDACRMRAIQILSDAYAGVNFTIELPLSDAYGPSPLRSVGELIRFSDGGKTWMGLITSIQIKAGFAKVSQTLELRAVEVPS